MPLSATVTLPLVTVLPHSCTTSVVRFTAIPWPIVALNTYTWMVRSACTSPPTVDSESMNRVCERVALTFPAMSVLVAWKYALSSAITLPMTFESNMVQEAPDRHAAPRPRRRREHLVTGQEHAALTRPPLRPIVVVGGRERRLVVPAVGLLAAAVVVDELLRGAEVPDHLEVLAGDRVAAHHELDVREVPRDLEVAVADRVAGAVGERIADQDVRAAVGHVDAARRDEVAADLDDLGPVVGGDAAADRRVVDEDLRRAPALDVAADGRLAVDEQRLRVVGAHLAADVGVGRLEVAVRRDGHVAEDGRVDHRARPVRRDGHVGVGTVGDDLVALEGRRRGG